MNTHPVGYFFFVFCIVIVYLKVKTWEKKKKKNLTRSPSSTEAWSACNSHCGRPDWHADAFVVHPHAGSRGDKLPPDTWFTATAFEKSNFCPHYRWQKTLDSIKTQPLLQLSPFSPEGHGQLCPAEGGDDNGLWVTCRNDFWENCRISGCSHLILTLLLQGSSSEAAIGMMTKEEISRWPVKHN